jgi:hypothetical protein
MKQAATGIVVMAFAASVVASCSGESAPVFFSGDAGSLQDGSVRDAGSSGQDSASSTDSGTDSGSSSGTDSGADSGPRADSGPGGDSGGSSGGDGGGEAGVVSLAPDPQWTVNGAYLTLNKSTPSTVFSANDCDKTSFAMTPATVDMVPYDVGDPSAPRIEAIPEGTATITMPGAGAWSVNQAHMIMPGGRGGDLPFQVTFNYTDATSASAGTVTIPHDCIGGGPLTSGTTTLVYQGSYTPISGPTYCCGSWWEGTFGNPNPAKQVASLTILYTASKNPLWGSGRVWAVTIN